MAIIRQTQCHKCDGTGLWTNPTRPTDKRTCFTCNGTGRISQSNVRAPTKPKALPRGEDFLDGILDGPPEGLIALAEAPTSLDETALVERIADRLTPIVRGEVASADAATRQWLLSHLPGIEDAMFARLTKRLPEVIELRRDNVPLPQVEGHQHPQFSKLLRLATSRNRDGYVPNIWITGPAGSGKTTGARMIAKALGVPFFFNGALETKFEAIGYKDASGHYHSTPLLEAWTQPSVYLFDDIDGCDSNGPVLALNAPLANNIGVFPDGTFERHPDCIIIATANTWGFGANADYVGRIKFDGAFLDRFGAKLHWGYDEPFEATLSGNPEWAARVQRARARAAEAKAKVLITPRATMAGAALIANGLTPDEAAEATYLAGMTVEQRRIFE